jgi:outer membrane murein-binding lipoprotein Lpp
MEDSHVAVLLEDLHSQFKVFGESLQATRDDVQATRDEMHAMRAELVAKIDGVADDVAVLKTDVADLKTRMTRVEGHLNGALPPRPSRRKAKARS